MYRKMRRSFPLAINEEEEGELVVVGHSFGIHCFYSVRAGVRVERFLIIVLVSIVVLVVCHTISHSCPQEHAKHPTTRNAINTTRKGPTTEFGVSGGPVRFNEIKSEMTLRDPNSAT